MSLPAAVIISSEYFRGHNYGRNHPLRIPRVALTLDLIGTYRSLAPDEHLEARKATAIELTQYHSEDYVAALQTCQSLGRIGPGLRQRFNIGNFENPYFENFFTIPALATGASIQGAELVQAGAMVFNPAGGMHHAMPAKARGFCYLNDAVLGIMRLRQAGWRVLYYDLDAHHGDGVQLAFDHDPEVLTVSFHMDTAYAYPRRGGRTSDTGSCGTAINLPLPESVNDSEYRLAFNALWPEIMNYFKPDAVVLQTGTDILYQDPLGKFEISNRLFIEVVSQVMKTAPRHPNGVPRLLVLGGGGYHPVALARCWTGVWGALAGLELPTSLPPQGRQVLENIQWPEKDDPVTTVNHNMFDSLFDSPREGPIRKEICRRVDQIRHSHPLFS